MFQGGVSRVARGAFATNVLMGAATRTLHPRGHRRARFYPLEFTITARRRPSLERVRTLGNTALSCAGLHSGVPGATPTNDRQRPARSSSRSDSDSSPLTDTPTVPGWAHRTRQPRSRATGPRIAGMRHALLYKSARQCRWGPRTPIGMTLLSLALSRVGKAEFFQTKLMPFTP